MRFARAGIHLCPLALLEQMEGKLREFTGRRKDLIETFLTAYPRLCQEAAKRLRSLYNPAGYRHTLAATCVKLNCGLVDCLRSLMIVLDPDRGRQMGTSESVAHRDTPF